MSSCFAGHTNLTQKLPSKPVFQSFHDISTGTTHPRTVGQPQLIDASANPYAILLIQNFPTLNSEILSYSPPLMGPNYDRRQGIRDGTGRPEFAPRTEGSAQDASASRESGPKEWPRGDQRRNVVMDNPGNDVHLFASYSGETHTRRAPRRVTLSQGASVNPRHPNRGKDAPKIFDPRD